MALQDSAQSRQGLSHAAVTFGVLHTSVSCLSNHWCFMSLKVTLTRSLVILRKQQFRIGVDLVISHLTWQQEHQDTKQSQKGFQSEMRQQHAE